jgi:hypothetical protein
MLLACSGPASSVRDAGTDAPLAHDASAARDVWFGDTSAADTGSCATAPSEADVQAVLLPTCAVAACHSRASPDPGGGLILDRGDARSDMVGVAPSFSPALDLVIPGDPGHSVLWRKLTGELAADGSEGAPMPVRDAPTWTPLPADQLEIVRCWIASGAP